MSEETTTPTTEKEPEDNTTPEGETKNQVEESSVKEKTSETPQEEKKNEGKSRRSRTNRRERGRTREPKEFEEAILQIDRVTRVVKGGRRLRFRVSVVIGDQKGRVGFGVGKATEVMIGIQKAVAKAKRSLMSVPIFNNTIPHEVAQTFKSSRVLLFPAPEGKGVIAGGAVRRILELAGVKNVLSKVHGSRNRLNVAHATLRALQKLTNAVPHGMKKEESSEKKEEGKDSDKEEKETPVKKAPAKKKAPVKKAEPKKTTKK